MDPKTQLVAYLQSMQAGGGPQGGAPMMQPGEVAGDAVEPEMEESEDGEEEYSHADMVAHHDSIAGLVQILLNMTNKGGNAKPMMASPSALEAKQGSYGK